METRPETGINGADTRLETRWTSLLCKAPLAGSQATRTASRADEKSTSSSFRSELVSDFRQEVRQDYQHRVFFITGFGLSGAVPAHCTLEGVPQFSFTPHSSPRLVPSLASNAVPRLQPLQAVATCSPHLVRRPRLLWCKTSVLLYSLHMAALHSLGEC